MLNQFLLTKYNAQSFIRFSLKLSWITKQWALFERFVQVQTNTLDISNISQQLRSKVSGDGTDIKNLFFFTNFKVLIMNLHFKTKHFVLNVLQEL